MATATAAAGIQKSREDRANQVDSIAEKFGVNLRHECLRMHVLNRQERKHCKAHRS